MNDKTDWKTFAQRIVAGLNVQPGELIQVHDHIDRPEVLQEVLLAIDLAGATPLIDPQSPTYLNRWLAEATPEAIQQSSRHRLKWMNEVDRVISFSGGWPDFSLANPVTLAAWQQIDEAITQIEEARQLPIMVVAVPTQQRAKALGISLDELEAQILPAHLLRIEESQRLHIRDLAEADWPALHALRTDPDVYRYNHFGPETAEETRTWIRETMVHNNLMPRFSHNCSIMRKATGEVIGWIGFGLPSPGKMAHSDLTFGYALLPAFWNQGYATEALRAMIDFAFTTTEAKSISDTCDVRNIGSARVMEKAGLRQVERFVEPDDEPGKPSEAYRYRILRSEWEATQRQLEINPAAPADIAEMTESFPDWGARQKHEDRWQQQQQGNAVYLVARRQGRPVGHAYLKWHGATDVHIVERRTMLCPDIEDIFVLGDWRSQGIGSALIRGIEDLALGQGFQHIGLSVGIENTAAQQLYERLGFQDAGFGVYTEQGTYLDEQGHTQVWEERCVYLIKELTTV